MGGAIDCRVDGRGDRVWGGRSGRKERSLLQSILFIMGGTIFYPKIMDAAKTIDTQVALPIELYQTIVQQAQAHKNSVSGEIVTLLTSVLMQNSTNLTQEFEAWEAASDEDWLNLEASLASQEH